MALPLCFGDYPNHETFDCERKCDKNEQVECYGEWSRREKALRADRLKEAELWNHVPSRYCNGEGELTNSIPRDCPHCKR